MIRVRFLKIFDESLSDLEPPEKRKAVDAVDKLLDYFSGGPKPLGLGLRKLKGNHWEVRASLRIRVLFILEKDLATFVLAGNHEAVRRKISSP